MNGNSCFAIWLLSYIYDYKIINIAIMKKNVQRSVKSTDVTAFETANLKTSLMILKSLKFYLISFLMIGLLCMVNTSKAQIITEGFEASGWVTSSIAPTSVWNTYTGYTTISASTSNALTSATTGPGTKVLFTYVVPFPSSGVQAWGTKTSFSTSVPVYSSTTGTGSATSASSVTSTLTGVVGTNTALTESMLSKWSSYQMYSYYAAGSSISGVSTIGTGTNTSTWMYSAAAVMATSNILTNGSKYVNTNNTNTNTQSLILDGTSVRGFIITPVLSGLVSVTVNVYMPTAASDFYILANTNVAVTGNASSLSKTVAASAANFSTNTASISNSWAGSYYGTIAANLTNNAAQSLTNPGGWQQVTFTKIGRAHV